MIYTYSYGGRQPSKTSSDKKKPLLRIHYTKHDENKINRKKKRKKKIEIMSVMNKEKKETKSGLCDVLSILSIFRDDSHSNGIFTCELVMAFLKKDKKKNREETTLQKEKQGDQHKLE